jgi:hypothetical protein
MGPVYSEQVPMQTSGSEHCWGMCWPSLLTGPGLTLQGLSVAPACNSVLIPTHSSDILFYQMALSAEAPLTVPSFLLLQGSL